MQGVEQRSSLRHPAFSFTYGLSGRNVTAKRECSTRSKGSKRQRVDLAVYSCPRCRWPDHVWSVPSAPLSRRCEYLAGLSFDRSVLCHNRTSWCNSLLQHRELSLLRLLSNSAN